MCKKRAYSEDVVKSLPLADALADVAELDGAARPLHARRAEERARGGRSCDRHTRRQEQRHCACRSATSAVAAHGMLRCVSCS